VVRLSLHPDQPLKIAVDQQDGMSERPYREHANAPRQMPETTRWRALTGARISRRLVINTTSEK
jgi:hypothetical protein